MLVIKMTETALFTMPASVGNVNRARLCAFGTTPPCEAATRYCRAMATRKRSSGEIRWS